RTALRHGEFGNGWDLPVLPADNPADVRDPRTASERVVAPATPAPGAEQFACCCAQLFLHAEKAACTSPVPERLRHLHRAVPESLRRDARSLRHDAARRC